MPVTFTPTSLGAVTSSYQLSWADAAGPHALTVPVTATGTASSSGTVAVPPPGGGWRLNGAAQMTGQDLQLTQASTANQAGSAVYSTPVAGGSVHASFTVAIGGGTGGDGLAFGLLDAGKSGPGALGGAGPQLGFGRLSGVAVTLNTFKEAGDPAANFAGIATSDPVHGLRYVKTTTGIPALRAGTHLIGVTSAGQQLSVTVDGKGVLTATLPAGDDPGQRDSRGHRGDREPHR